MSKALSNEPSLYLIAVGAAQGQHIRHPETASYPVGGLTFRHVATDGRAVDVFVAAPTDLVAYADLLQLPFSSRFAFRSPSPR